jgi:hypothetical protein
MKSVIGNEILKNIDEAIADIKKLEDIGITDSNKAYLAKFLIVYISGLYEKLIKNILVGRALLHHDEYTANFILGFRWYSPKFENIISLLDRFNKGWGVELRRVDKKYQDAISSIANNKNNIAHGEDISLTLNDVYNYYSDSKILIHKIDEIILGV